MKTRKLAVLTLTCLLSVQSFTASAQPFVISADGNEVTDQHSGLIWRRCSEGMSWNGSTCTGTASTFTHEAALQQAAAQATSTKLAWRLPNIKELYSIVDKTLSAPAIDATAFPATPAASGFWSSSPDVGTSTRAWSVYSGDGVFSSYYRTSNNCVRLVRTAK